MSTTVTNWAPLALKGILALAFIGAGLAKLAGVEMMVATFETLGFGQWFRYVTALIEIGSAILLFVPGMQALGAGLLVCTMIAAVLAHFLVLGPSAVPATILGILSGLVLYLHRDQLPVR